MLELDVPLWRRTRDDVAAVIAAATTNAANRMCDNFLWARYIAGFGVDREGLMMRALMIAPL
jgi:hypothetical protein